MLIYFLMIKIMGSILTKITVIYVAILFNQFLLKYILNI